MVTLENFFFTESTRFVTSTDADWFRNLRTRFLISNFREFFVSRIGILTRSVIGEDKSRFLFAKHTVVAILCIQTPSQNDGTELTDNKN